MELITAFYIRHLRILDEDKKFLNTLHNIYIYL